MAKLNRETALERVDGDEELYLEIVELFLDDLPELLRELSAAVERGDAETVDHMAHKIKGSVGNLGGVGAQEAAGRLEAIGRSRDLDTVQPALERLLTELDELKLDLDGVVADGWPAA